MSIKIRCSGCTKKISIDEAFAGGVCRCPYCKETNFVPGDIGSGQIARSAGPTARPQAPSQRPQAPVRRPETPAAPEAPGAPQTRSGQAGGRHEGEPKHIPMANPVRLQGIVSIVLIVLIVALVGLSVYLIYTMVSDSDGPPPPPTETEYANPFQADDGNVQTLGEGEAAVAGSLKFEPPVVYVIDAGSSMRATYDYARTIARISLGTLDDGDKFTVLVAYAPPVDFDAPMEEMMSSTSELKTFAPNLTAKSDRTPQKVAEWLGGVRPGGSTNLLEALRAAIALEPESIVLLAAKPVEDAMPAAEEAKSKGIRVITVGLSGADYIVEGLKTLAETTGGVSRSMSVAELDQYLSDTN